MTKLRIWTHDYKNKKFPNRGFEPLTLKDFYVALTLISRAKNWIPNRSYIGIDTKSCRKGQKVSKQQIPDSSRTTLLVVYSYRINPLTDFVRTIGSVQVRINFPPGTARNQAHPTDNSDFGVSTPRSIMWGSGKLVEPTFHFQAHFKLQYLCDHFDGEWDEICYGILNWI